MSCPIFIVLRSVVRKLSCSQRNHFQLNPVSAAGALVILYMAFSVKQTAALLEDNILISVTYFLAMVWSQKAMTEESWLINVNNGGYLNIRHTVN